MKILYITHSPILGGAELALLSHLRYLDKTKFDVTLLCSHILVDKAKEIEGITVIPMEFYLLFRPNPMVIINYIRMVYKIWKTILTNHIDIVHTNSVKAHYIGTMAALLTRRKLVWWIRDDTMNIFIYKLTKWIPRSIVFISEYIQKKYGQSKKGIVIYNGTDIYKKTITEEEKKTLKENLGITDQSVILCTDRLVLWKGIDVLIESLLLLKNQNYMCLLIGTGKDQRDSIEFDLIKKVSEYHLIDKVKFLGWRNDTYKFYQIADVFVHPILKPEPFGLVIIEAMSFGLPVISSYLGGPKEIIDTLGQGILIRPNDPHILAEKLDELLQNPQERQEIGERAKERVMNTFKQEIETYSIENIYETI